MTNASNLDELKRLSENVCGKPSEADSIADAIAEIANGYSGGSSGSGVNVVSVELYPDSNDVIQSGKLGMSDGSSVNVSIKYIPEFNVNSVAGSTAGTTKLSVENTLTSGNSYVYTFDRSPSLPAIGEKITEGIAWNGVNDIECEDGAQITVIEVNAQMNAVKAGTVAGIIAY